MNKLFLTAMTTSLLTLTACGGGGGDDDVQVNQSVQPFTMKEQNVVWKISEQDADNNLIPLNTPTTTQAGQDGNITQLKIGNKTFPLTNGSLQTTGDFKFYEYETDTAFIVSGGDTAYARYGWGMFATATQDVAQMALFYQGMPTSIDEMKALEKQADNVTYTGQAIAVKQGNYNSNLSDPNPLAIGKTQLTANFKNKTLKGSIGQWESSSFTLKPVTIDAKIQANTFQGTANKTGTAEGKFYGTNAANLAGSFNDKSQKLRGVFGGVKK